MLSDVGSQPIVGGDLAEFQELGSLEKGYILTPNGDKGRRSFPQSELHGITSQMRRSSASIRSEIPQTLDYQRLFSEVVEVEKMLRVLLWKLRAVS